MPKKILIVEDEEWLSSAMESMFRIEHFIVLTASNGNDGLLFCKKEMPDIIILDIVMPGMDGLTMLEHLRNDEKTKDIPAIIFTNFPDNEKIAKALASGSCDYLVKSDWKIEDVVQKVKEKLGI